MVTYTVFVPKYFWTEWLNFVGRCLATKSFYRQIASYGMGIGDHRVAQWWEGVIGQQNSCKMLFGVHSTMHLVHPKCVLQLLLVIHHLATANINPQTAWAMSCRATHTDH